MLRTRSKPLQFGRLVLDLNADQLSFDGKPVAMSHQPLTILKLLAERPGELVTRDELQQALWPNASRIDTTRRLNTAIRALRTALRDSADDSRWIETVRGSGYRFTGQTRPTGGLKRRALAAVLVVSASLSVAQLASESTRPSAAVPPDLAPYLSALAVRQHPDPATRITLNRFVDAYPHYQPAVELQAWFALDHWRRDRTQANLAAAGAAIARGMAKAGQSAELLRLQGELRWDGFGDGRGAAAALTASLARVPQQTGPHRTLAWIALASGDQARARNHLQVLMTEFELTAADRADAGWLWLRLGEPAQSQSLCQSNDADDARRNLLSCEHTARFRQGDLDGALEVAVELMRVTQAPPALIEQIHDMDPRPGYQRFLVWRIDAFAPRSHFQRAQLLADAGQFAAATTALAASIAAAEPQLTKLTSTQEFAPLKRTPVYQEALRRAGSMSG